MPSPAVTEFVPSPITAAAVSKPSPTDSIKHSPANFINHSPAAAASGIPTAAAAANSELLASMTAATAPALPPGFEEYIQAQKTQIVTPAVFPGAASLPDSKRNSFPVSPGFKEYVLAQKQAIAAAGSSPLQASASPKLNSSAVPDGVVGEKEDADAESEEGLDGLTSQLGNFSLNQDDEGGTFSFTSDRLDPAGSDGQPLDRLFTESVFSVNNSLCRISGKLQFALVWPWTWISCSGWFWYNDGFDIVNEGVSSMSKRHRGEENSSHDDDSTELN